MHSPHFDLMSIWIDGMEVLNWLLTRRDPKLEVRSTHLNLDGGPPVDRNHMRGTDSVNTGRGKRLGRPSVSLDEPLPLTDCVHMRKKDETVVRQPEWD